MKPSIGRQSCDCCEDIYNQEFQKIVELKDAGVAIYRYLPQTRDEKQLGTTADAEEIFVLRNIGDEDLKLEEFIVELGKTNISCPRCVKMIEHAGKLFRSLPKANIREITSVCDHCYMRQRLHCPCCEQIVDKFLTFCTDEAQQREEKRQRVKSWLRKTQILLKKTLLNVKDSKLEPRARSEGRIQEMSPTFNNGVKENRIATARSFPTTKHISQPASFLKISREMIVKDESERLKTKKRAEEESTQGTPLKVAAFLDFSEEPVKTKAKLKENSILKAYEGDGVPEDIAAPYGERRRSVSPSKMLSFETVIKSPSEPDVSVFSYTFPQEKISTKKQIKGRISSSELIKDTQQMLQERAEAEKKKREEELKQKREEDDRKKLERDKKRRIYAENKLLTKKPDIEKRKSVEITKFIKESSILFAPVSSRSSKGLTAETIKHESKHLIEKEVTVELKEPIAKQAKVIIQKPVVAEKEKKVPPEVKPDDNDQVAKGKKMLGKTQETEQSTKVEKQHHIAATDDLKQQITKPAKEVVEEEKERKNQEKIKKLGEEKAKEAEKSIEKQQLATENKLIRTESKAHKDDVLEKKHKDQVIAKEPDQKARVEKQHDIAATTDLKQQMAKQAKAESVEAKNRKKQERDLELAEKKGKQVENRIEEKQQPITTQQIVDSEVEPEKHISLEKVKEPEQKAKEEKEHDTTAATILREQLAEQKQAELEKEKNRIQQEKEREIIEKKSKEVEKAKVLQLYEPAIKPPSLKPEDDFSSFSKDISEITIEQHEVTDIIIGEKICQSRDKKCHTGPPIITSEQSERLKHYGGKRTGHKPEQSKRYDEQKPGQPKQFSDDYAEQPKVLTEEISEQQKIEQQPEKPKYAQKSEDPKPAAITTDNKTIKLPPDPEASKGVIRYALSDCTFIDKGWTMLPTEKVVRKMNVYRMRPAKPEFDWFEHHKYKRAMTYDTGEMLAEFDDNGRGRWYYRNGKLALDYYDAEETNAGQRFVVYSNGEPDERGRSRPRTVLATFDYLGNGIVFDHSGKIRLKYNQTEGVVLDRAIGPVSHWKWHTLNDPPILQQVMIDTQMPYKDPRILKMADKNAVDIKRPENEEMLAIEFENFLKEKSQKLTQSFKPFQIRMKAMKINENFSLRVMDQASVYLLFRDGTTNLKINIGMVLDHKEIVDTDTAEIGEVSNTLDKLPACTDSIAGLQRAVARAQAQERARVRHETSLKRSQLSNSLDELHAGCSRPLRPPVLPCASATSNSRTTPSRFKPTCCNLYYNTQLY